MGHKASYTNQKKIQNEQLFRVEDSALVKTLMHRSIGAITFITKNKKMGIGTGFLISNNLVLTAAHNVYDKSEKYVYDEIKFYLGANGVGTMHSEIEGWRLPLQFRTCSASVRLQFDYALLKLKKNVGYDGFLELTHPCETCLISKNKDVKVEIFGYPFYYENGKPLDKDGERIKLYQFGLARKNRISMIDRFKIGYAISTEGGQSGCPIFADEKLIALHSGGGMKSENFNVGRFITEDLINNLKQWCQEMKGNLFVINDTGLCKHLQHLEQLQNIDMRSISQRSENPKEIKESLNSLKQLSIHPTQSQRSVIGISESLFNCLQIQERMYGKGSLETLTTLNSIGNAYEQSKDYKLALQYFNRCLQIKEKIKGKECLDSASTLHKIGNVHRNQGNYPKALQNYMKCLEIQLKNTGVGKIELALTLNNIGLVFMDQEKYEQALEYFLRSLAIKQQVKGKGSIQTASTLMYIGIAHKNLGNYIQALENYFLSLEIKEKIKGKQSNDVALILNNIGSVYKDQENFPQAIKYFKKAIKTYEVLQLKSKDYAASLFSLGSTFSKMNSYELSARSYQQSLAIYQQLKQRNMTRKSAIKLSKILKILKEEGKLQEIIQRYQLNPQDI